MGAGLPLSVLATGGRSYWITLAPMGSTASIRSQIIIADDYAAAERAGLKEADRLSRELDIVYGIQEIKETR